MTDCLGPDILCAHLPTDYVAEGDARLGTSTGPLICLSSSSSIVSTVSCSAHSCSIMAHRIADGQAVVFVRIHKHAEIAQRAVPAFATVVIARLATVVCHEHGLGQRVDLMPYLVRPRLHGRV